MTIILVASHPIHFLFGSDVAFTVSQLFSSQQFTTVCKIDDVMVSVL